MRDAIVYAGWTWEASNVPERISLALARLGCRVLHCAGPVSILRSRPRPMREVSAGIHTLQLMFVSSRLNSVPGCSNLQATMLHRQIQAGAEELGLRDPLFLYPPLGELFPLCVQMKRNHFVVHICMDHSSSVAYDRFVEASDKTLALPKSSFHKFRAKFGDKVEIMPQSVDLTRLACPPNNGSREPTVWASIPRPRLGYFSAPRNVLNLPLLRSLLESHPDWHFVSVGPEKAVPLPNAHTLPWTRPDGFASYLQSFDVGFMPYNCYDEERLHMFPAKIFEYFAFGIPVVATPLIHLWEYKGLIYFGDTAEELSSAIEAALTEPHDSSKRTARVEIARKHSLENLATVLHESLPLESQSYSLAG
jgi:hypothetical protein